MRKVLFAVALACAAGCSGSSTSHEDPVTAGPGIKIDPSTHAIGIDDSRVPMMPACAAGQIVRRGADGWECGASAPDSAQLGGKPAASYLTTDATAANASSLEGRPASFFLAAGAQAADSAMLGGVPAASYQLAASPAADSLKLGGFDAAAYLKADAVAADSARLGGKAASAYQLASSAAANAMALNGHPDSFFLPAAGVAADSAKLGAKDASLYQLAANPASNSLQLGGVASSSYLRKDVASQTVAAPFSIVDGREPVASFDAKRGFSVGPVSSSGNVTAAGQINAGKDANVKGTVFTTNLTAEGSAHVVGDVAAGSFNGLALFAKNGSNVTCESLCLEAGGTCVAAKLGLSLPGRPVVLKASRCDGTLFPLPFDAACFCASIP